MAISQQQKKALILKSAAKIKKREEAESVRPDFFRDFLPHCKILTNEQELSEETQLQAAPEVATFELYDYQREMIEAWLNGDSECILKGRQIGISWCDAVYTLYRAVVDKWNCGFVSYKENVARWHLRNRIRFIWDRLPNKLNVDGVEWPLPKARWNADSAEFDGAGSILIFPSTPDAGVGYTFQKVTMDEFAFHDYAMPNYEALRPALPRGAQFIIFSTSNPELGEYGPFKKMWDSANKRGFSKRFLPWNIRPEHTMEFYREEKDAYEGSENQFKAFHPLEETDAFSGKSGLVFPQFVDGYPHVQEPSCDWSEYKFRVAGIDPGGGDPTAIVPLGITHDWVFEQPWEFYTKEVVTLDEMFDWLWRLHGEAPFDYIWMDAPRKSPYIAQLQWRGLPVVGANKDKGARLSMHAWVLEQRRLRIAPGCVNSRAEYAGYMFPERTDPNTKDKYRTSTPVDHHGDAIDARGYAILGAMEAIRRGTNDTPPRIEYNRAPRKNTPLWSDPWEARAKPPGVTYTRR